MHVLPYGRRAVLAVAGDPGGVGALVAALRSNPPAGVAEFVPAAETVLVRVSEPADLAGVTTWLEQSPWSQSTNATGPTGTSPGELVEIPVVYDGADLEQVARWAGTDVAGVVALHSAALYTVTFCGFSPGFAYLEGLPAPLHVPRRPSPRAEVPAGSVAVADRWSAVYPRSSPGGWQLLGRTDLTLWDLDQDPPARLVPGTRVRFVAR